LEEEFLKPMGISQYRLASAYYQLHLGAAPCDKKRRPAAGIGRGIRSGWGEA
jgi:hypothetical protein